jgi:peptidoglycan/LPS O-acetylase OafA/YrhL
MSDRVQLLGGGLNAPQPSPSARGGGIRVEMAALDGVRGLLSLFVVVGHILTFWIPSPGTIPSNESVVPAGGLIGLEYLSPVTLFFVLSGYTLTHVYRDSAEGAGGPPAAAAAAGALVEETSPPAPSFSTSRGRVRFFFKRVARLAPSYYLGVALGVVPTYVYSGGNLGNFITGVVTTVLGAQATTLTGASVDGPLWTVSALLLCYSLFPVLCRNLKTWTEASLWTLFGVCVAVSAVLAAVWLLFLNPVFFDNAAAIILHIFSVFRLPHFTIGVIAAELQARGRLFPGEAAAAAADEEAQEEEDRLGDSDKAAGDGVAEARVAVAVTSAVLTAASAGCVVYVALTAPNFAGMNLYAYFSEFLVPGIHAVWIAALCAPERKAVAAAGGGGGGGGDAAGLGAAAGLGSLVRRTLASRPLHYLGRVSYALYCLHYPTLSYCAWAVAGGVSADAVPYYQGWAWMFFRPLWAVLPLVAVCLVVATLAHLAFERGTWARRKGGK